MLNPEDRDAIEGLFERLEAVERKAPPRDAEAEALIGRRVAAQPAAPYYMAQTILVQQQGLDLAQARIEELEGQLARRGNGGLFGGLFGDQQPERGNAVRTPPQDRNRGPWDRDTGGGGFLAGAAQTALGVTTGVLLGSAIAGMLGGGGEANAAEPQDAGNDAADQPEDADPGGDDGGDFGGFDLGGDF